MDNKPSPFFNASQTILRLGKIYREITLLKNYLKKFIKVYPYTNFMDKSGEVV